MRCLPRVSQVVWGIRMLCGIVLYAVFAAPVSAQVSQTPTAFPLRDDGQTVTFTFENTTTGTVTELNAYTDQTYIQVSDQPASLASCATVTYVDVGNIRFSDCTIDPGATVQGQFVILTPEGTYTENDLSMNYTYGDESNQVAVTVTQSVATPEIGAPTGTPTPHTDAIRVVTPTPQPTANPTPTPIPDTQPPSVRLATSIASVYQIAPTIRGSVTDTSGVRNIEYSLDGGINYTSVDTIGGTPTARTFTFTPRVTVDDNYAIVVRARDTAGNTVRYEAGTLILDKLPPRIGAVVLKYGMFELTGNYAIPLVLHTPYQVAVSAVGGVTQMSMRVGEVSANVPLRKNHDSGVWEGEVLVNDPGEKKITFVALDGAGNETMLTAHRVIGVTSGTISGESGPIAGVRVHVLARKRDGSFVPWNPREYGLVAPRDSTSHGTYAVQLPPGEYSIRFEKSGYQVVQSQVITLTQPSIIEGDIRLDRQQVITIGMWKFIPFWNMSARAVTVRVRAASTDAPFDDSLQGSTLPDMSFLSGGDLLTTVSLRGKPTVLTFLSLWSPASLGQLRVLESLRSHSALNIVGVVSQQSYASVAVFATQGGYHTTLVADPEGVATNAVKLPMVPTTLLIGQNGTVIQSRTGLVTADEIMQILFPTDTKKMLHSL